MTSKRIGVIVAIPVLCLTLVQCDFFQALFGPKDDPLVLAPVVGRDYLASSYELQKSSLYVELGLGMLPGGYTHNVAYADFDLDGDEDIFYPVDGDGDERKDVALFFNNGENEFESRPDYFEGAVPTAVHPQKAIVGDFNGDSRPDVFVADVMNFDGTYNLAVYSTPTGLAYDPGLESLVEDTYAVASADIDGDNDLDILVAARPPYFLINDGAGNLSYDESRVASTFWGGDALELVDVDSDGCYDIVRGGQEFDADPTVIYWGDGSGSYADSPSVVLPAVDTYGIVLDFDCEDLDGDRDIIVTRSLDNPGQGFCLQYLRNDGDRTFTDVSEERLTDYENLQHWCGAMARLQDIDGDGDIDCFADNRALMLVWLNDGMECLRDWYARTAGRTQPRPHRFRIAAVNPRDLGFHRVPHDWCSTKCSIIAGKPGTTQESPG